MKRIVLVGNQNCGKTTLFNALTGMDQHTGNWPGVTVERKSGMLRGREQGEVIDLPGTYSLMPYTEEEKVTRDMLLGGGYDAIINVVDATCLGRGLYLTHQLLRLGRPVVVALNMMDEVRRQGMHIDVEKLSQALGAPVLPVTARTGEGLQALTDAALSCKATGAPAPVRTAPVPAPEEITACYQQIDSLLGRVVRQNRKTERLTEKLDHILLQTPMGLPMIALLLMLVLWLAFGPVASWMKAGCELLIDRACIGAELVMGTARVSGWLQGLVTEGIVAGVGSVLSFLPTILLLLTGLSLLEDSGLMARAVYLLDRPLRNFDLSGRSFIPLLLGFGCTVPAAMAVRGMSGKREQIVTTLLLPFMSCGAKLPVYALFAQAFFAPNAWLVTAALYTGGILLAMAAAKMLASSAGGTAPPLLMELPTYRLPTLRSVLRGMLDRAGEFVRRTFSIILLATIAVWLMQHFTPGLAWTDELSASILGRLAGLAAPVFRPLGFGTVEASAALMTGILAKESVISTLTVLCGEGGMAGLFPTAASAMAFLTFVLLYTPCIAALSAMTQSLGRKRHALCAGAAQFALAWGAAFWVHRLVMMI